MERKKKTDLRVLRSQRAIREAFWKLMEEGGISNVNVQKIVDLAGMNRSTFYAYYTDKYDLLDKMEAELLGGITEIAESFDIKASADADVNQDIFHSYVLRMIDYLEENASRFLAVAGEGGDRAFREKLNNEIEGFWNRRGVGERIGIPERYLIAALSGMITSLLAEWMNSGFAMEKDELARMIEKLATPFIEFQTPSKPDASDSSRIPSSVRAGSLAGVPASAPSQQPQATASAMRA